MFHKWSVLQSNLVSFLLASVEIGDKALRSIRLSIFICPRIVCRDSVSDCAELTVAENVAWNLIMPKWLNLYIEVIRRKYSTNWISVIVRTRRQPSRINVIFRDLRGYHQKKVFELIYTNISNIISIFDRKEWRNSVSFITISKEVTHLPAIDHPLTLNQISARGISFNLY